MLLSRNLRENGLERFSVLGLHEIFAEQKKRILRFNLKSPLISRNFCTKTKKEAIFRGFKGFFDFTKFLQNENSKKAESLTFKVCII